MVNKTKSFWKDLKAEYNKISWPKREDLIKKTIIVLSISIVITLIIFGFDMIYNFLLKDVIANV